MLPTASRLLLNVVENPVTSKLEFKLTDTSWKLAIWCLRFNPVKSANSTCRETPVYGHALPTICTSLAQERASTVIGPGAGVATGVVSQGIGVEAHAAWLTNTQTLKE